MAGGVEHTRFLQEQGWVASAGPVFLWLRFSTPNPVFAGVSYDRA